MWLRNCFVVRDIGIVIDKNEEDKVFSKLGIRFVWGFMVKKVIGYKCLFKLFFFILSIWFVVNVVLKIWMVVILFNKYCWLLFFVFILMLFWVVRVMLVLIFCCIIFLLFS